MAKEKITNEEIVEVLPIKKAIKTITIVGDSPLIVHAWSEKAKKEMLEKQTKVAKAAGKPVRDPFKEFVDALYWITPRPEKMDDMEDFIKACEDGAKFGFSAMSIKLAAQSAAYRSGVERNKAGLRGDFFIFGEGGQEFGIIETDEPPVMREDMVKIGGVSKVSDLRYRPMFENWKMKLMIVYNENASHTFKQIVNYINMAGFMNGIGEWRPERDGLFGTFHVE